MNKLFYIILILTLPLISFSITNTTFAEISPTILNYTFNESASDITINPTTDPVVINLTANMNVKWVSMTIENVLDNTTYKRYMLSSSCDDTALCNEAWDGSISPSDKTLIDGVYRIKIHIDNSTNLDDDFNDYLSPHTIIVNTSAADTTPPTITIGDYIKTPTNQDIIVTATTNEGVLNATSTVFISNGSFDFVAVDSAGNIATSTVTITNIDKIAPEIAISGNSPVRVKRGTTYTDAGAIVTDNIDTELNATSTSNVNTSTNGTYYITYGATDSHDNSAIEKTRTVIVYSSSGRRHAPQTETTGEVLGAETGPKDIANFTSTTTEEKIVDSSFGGTTTEPIIVPVGEVLGAETFKFLTNLRFGERNNDVLELQKRLAFEGLFTASTTGYFGPATKASVIQYQEKYIPEILSLLGLTKGTGFVGPYTRTKLNQ